MSTFLFDLLDEYMKQTWELFSFGMGKKGN